MLYCEMRVNYTSQAKFGAIGLLSSRELLKDGKRWGPKSGDLKRPFATTKSPKNPGIHPECLVKGLLGMSFFTAPLP